MITALDYVLVDTASPLSLTGRSFWKKQFVDSKEMLVEDASWIEFQKGLWKTFATPEDTVDPRNHEIALKCLKELLCKTKQKEEASAVFLCFLHCF